MKKLVTAFLTIYMLSITAAAAPGYEPGISGEATSNKGEFKYKEVVFVSGEPVLLEGTISVKEDSRGTKTTLEYELFNTQEEAQLTRKVVFLNSASSNSLGNQTTYASSLDPKYDETIQIGSDTYELTEYLFTRSGLIDDKTIIRYVVSDWNGSKTYSKNDGAGEVKVDFSTNMVGYNNYWSSTETSFYNYSITYTYKEDVTDTDFEEAYGTVEFAVSDSTVRNMEYINNDPKDISFKGGYVLKEGQENIVSYIYDLPDMDEDAPEGKRAKGRNSFNTNTVPVLTRTFAPTIKDVPGNYWAAEDIKKIVSMDIISVQNSSYFMPRSFMSRGEFAKAIVKACDISLEDAAKKKLKTYTPTFIDVDKNHPYYDYIEVAAKMGVMGGTSNTRFSPDEYLTKAEAAAIIVRAMGLEEASDASSTKTAFRDDGRVAAWAKKPINVAHRMGIISANSYNEIEPDRLMTRAESSAMLNKFIRYLQFDIRKEYREKIINFGR
ncbi:MAG TPA: S-layer homology domain-containing protein [Clostridia bacterium]|nr:S-layer homology domain-containing protein [Clostridia bacterium]